MQNFNNDEIINFTFEIVPDTAIASTDYEYQSSTATFDADTGVYTDTLAIAGGSFDGTFSIDILADDLIEEAEIFTVNIIDVTANTLIGVNSASVTIEDADLNANPILDSVNTDVAQAIGIESESNNLLEPDL